MTHKRIFGDWEMTVILKFPNSDLMHDFVDQHRDYTSENRWTFCSTNNETATLTIKTAFFPPEKMAAAKKLGAVEVPASYL